MHCQLLAIARGSLGDICAPPSLDYLEQGYQKGVVAVAELLAFPLLSQHDSGIASFSTAKNALWVMGLAGRWPSIASFWADA